MYEAYWNLRSTPFGGRIGEGWFYESPSHEEALARIDFLIEQRRQCGILAGAAGTGKTALLVRLAKQVRRSQRHSVMIDLCGVSGDELLCQLADALHLAPAAGARPFLLWRGVRDSLHGLARAEQQMVLIFDHFDRAQAGCAAVLEQLIHLSEETGCWCTVLIALEQASAAESLAPLVRLADLRIELSPLSRRETAYYVYESLRQSGAERELFEPQALDAVFAVTGGVPREINRLCELSLLVGMADGRRTIDAETVVESADNLPTPGSSRTALTIGDKAAAVA